MNVSYNNKPAIMRRNGQVVLGDVGGLIFQFIAIDINGNELGATEQIKVESVSTETVTEVQAIFIAKLATPQNVTANGTTVSWDAVENATSYAVLADGSEIGTVEGATTDELAGTWVFNDILTNTYAINLTYNVNFISNSTNFVAIKISSFIGNLKKNVIYTHENGTNISMYNRNWKNSVFKIITITSKLSEVSDGDTLLAWLQANATKQ